MKKWLIRFAILLLLIIIGMAAWAYYNMRDRHPGYKVSIAIKGEKKQTTYKIGFAKQSITPTVTDTWNDIDNNAKYNENEGDSYNDNNKNGKFDAVWIAGFSNAKPANGIHDKVWARAVVIDDGTTRMALVSLDAVGFMYCDVVDIRKALPKNLALDYTLISSTHTHESCDLVGIWGPDEFHSGVDPEHMKYVKAQTVRAVKQAVAALRPAKLVFAQDLSGRDSLLIKDTRKPIVKATGIHVLQAIDAERDNTLGTIVNWANHPETLWSKNLLISSDFPHYIRETMENGIKNNGEVIQEAYGGICVFFNGAIGGLMTPHASMSFNDPVRDTVFTSPSFEKTRTLGEQIALLAMNALSEGDTLLEMSPISLQAKSIILPLDNKIFRLASAIGLLKRGMPKLFSSRTEVAAFNFGPASFLSIPGEIYPEIIYGGIVNPPGRDFEIEPVEVPALQEKMKKQYKFYIGLSNDEIGYIVPKSEWDDVEPWLYLDKNDTYGEENSLGPETAPLIYKALSDVLEKLEE